MEGQFGPQISFNSIEEIELSENLQLETDNEIILEKANTAEKEIA